MAATSQRPAKRAGGPKSGTNRRQKPRASRRRPRPPRGSKTKRRWGRWISVLLVGTALAAAGAFYWSNRTLRSFEVNSNTGEGHVALVWHPGTTPAQAALLFSDLGLTRDIDKMERFLRSSEVTAGFAAGTHLLPRDASPLELVELMSRTEQRPKAKLVIPEGFHRFSIAKRLEKLGIVTERDFLHASADVMLLDSLQIPSAEDAGPLSAEGFLFPATYHFPKNSLPEEIVGRLVRESNQRWQQHAERYPTELAKLAAELSWGRREIVILASIIEKEAAVDDERSTIASVFLNRLTDPTFQPRLLQSDPTAGYGCLVFPNDAPSCTGFEGRITPSINRDRLNRYSTYTHPGLPPGPICNPGERSIDAVLSPSKTEYFYFFATGKGRHHFSATYDEHRQVIAERR